MRGLSPRRSRLASFSKCSCLGCHRNGERRGVEEHVHDHARVNAVGTGAEVGETEAEDDQHRQGLDQAMPEAEHDSEYEDRGGLSDEAFEKVETEPAEGQLLGDRPDEGERDEVDRERGGMLRLPPGWRQALLPPAMEQGVEDRVRDPDDEKDAEPEPESLCPRAGLTQREDLSLRQSARDEEDE